MEYSELANAFSENNTKKINELMTELRPRLISFLYIHMDASMEDAEDCAQNAFLKSLETIKNGQMRDTEQLLSFLLSTCRNNYLNSQSKKKPHLVNRDLDQTKNPPKQITELLDKERQELLSQCINKLPNNYQTFIEYWFSHPGSTAKSVANHFKISVSNVWTKKHRIIKKLKTCYQNKIKK